MMNFSVAFSSNVANLVCWSPDGRYLAVPDNNKLYIKDSLTASNLFTSYVCYDFIKLLQWSPDSSMILTGTPSSSSTATAECPCVEVWSINNPDWRCRIQLGSAGLLTASWAPDSRHVLTTDLLHLRITIWSLVNKSVACIKNPKDCGQGLQFSSDGCYLAALERIDCKDHLTILEAKSWQLVKQFPLSTSDAAGLAWGCGGDAGTATIIAVWDSILAYNLTLYAMCGRVLSSVCGAESYGHGVRGAAWSPTGKHLVIGGHDTKLRVMSYMTWDITSERAHSPIIEGKTGSNSSQNTTSSSTGNRFISTNNGENITKAAMPVEEDRVRVFKEVTKALVPPSAAALASGTGGVNVQLVTRETAYEEELCRPVHLAMSCTPTPFTSPGITACLNVVSGGFRGAGHGIVNIIENGAVSGGVTAMLFSHDGRYLATRVQQLPTVVWVWSVPKLSLLAVLVHSNSVRDLSWSPRHARLAVCTGEETLFLWTAFGSLTVVTPVPLRMLPTAVRWHPSGRRLLLIGRGGGQFCVCSVGSTERYKQELRGDETVTPASHSFVATAAASSVTGNARRDMPIVLG